MRKTKLSISLISLIVGIIMIIIGSIMTWFTDGIISFYLFMIGSILMFSVAMALLGASILNLFSKK